MPPVPKPTRRKRDFKRPTVKEMLPLEENEQATVARWLEAHGIRFQASAMGSYMHPATFLKAKKMGCQAGHPDLIIYDRPTPVENGTLYVGTCIEMKRRKGGVVSEDQKEWLAALEERGWKCKVALGCDDAISFLEACGYRDRR